MARKLPTQIADKMGFVHRTSADNDKLHPGIEVGLDGIFITNAPAHL